MHLNDPGWLQPSHLVDDSQPFPPFDAFLCVLVFYLCVLCDQLPNLDSVFREKAFRQSH